jgi:hypothetical protein
MQANLARLNNENPPPSGIFQTVGNMFGTYQAPQKPSKTMFGHKDENPMEPKKF